MQAAMPGKLKPPHFMAACKVVSLGGSCWPDPALVDNLLEIEISTFPGIVPIVCLVVLNTNIYRCIHRLKNALKNKEGRLYLYIRITTLLKSIANCV